MTKTLLLTRDVWRALTSCARSARKPAYIAVAYFGKGAGTLLPLPPQSRLVVDASENAVRSGQTCPAELKRLQKREVIIYSVANLHAKIYAFDSVVFIGSANASNRAANTLIETMIRTGDSAVVRSARQFVRRLMRDEVTPGRLDNLAKIYRPPRIGFGQTPREARHPQLPRLLLAQTVGDELSENAKQARADGLVVAKKRQKHKRYELDDFWWPGHTSPFLVGDKLIEVFEERRGKKMVSPPGEIIHLRRWSNGKERKTFVFYEYPDLPRIRLERLARRIGYGAKKKLSRNGLVRNNAFADKLLASFGA